VGSFGAVFAKLPWPLVFLAELHFCECFRLDLTSYEQAIGIGKRPCAATPARKKRKKDCDNEQRTEKNSREDSDTMTGDVPSVSPSLYDCEASLRDTEIICRRHRCRGWFLSSWLWPQANNTSENVSSDNDDNLNDASGRSSSNDCADSSVDFASTLARHAANSEIVELLRMECPAAEKWFELKHSRQEEDIDNLLSSPAGVLWKGRVKPLVKPSQASSVGNIRFDVNSMSKS